MSEQKEPAQLNGNVEKPTVRGELKLTFLSDGSINIDADGIVGMMDMWASSRLCEVKGDEIYVQGMTMMRQAMAAEEAKDPTKRLVLARELPEAKA